MDTFKKSVAIGFVFVVLFCGMIVASAMDIGRPDPFAGSAEESREYCGNTPPNMMNDRELQRCAWLREEDERPFVSDDDFATDAVEFSAGYNDP